MVAYKVPSTVVDSTINAAGNHAPHIFVVQ